MAPVSRPQDWLAAPLAALQASLGSGLDGLSSDEAAARLSRHGPNTLRPEPSGAVGRLLLRQLADPLVLILLGAAVLSGLMRDFGDTIIIVAVVVVSAALGFVQEYRSSRAVERLRDRMALRCRVTRGGSDRELPAQELVPGDVVQLRAGSLVPADGRLLAARDLHVNEAALTGESLPAAKDAGAAEPRDRGLFMGTSVASGTGVLLVVATGAATEYGAISAALSQPVTDTEFERGLRRFGVMLTQLILVLVIAVFAISVLVDRPALEALMFAIALAVGISPELLPAIISVTLAQGAREMLKHGVLVRRLGAIENLGAMDVLCSDKTGTLTQGAITLAGAIDARGQASARVLQQAAVNAWLESGLTNPLDDAIKTATAGSHDAVRQLTKVDEIPYDFERRRLTVVVRGADGRHQVVTKGAVDETLAVCSSERDADGCSILDADRRAAIQSLCDSRLSSGYRMLAVASREVDPRPAYDRDCERDLCLEGFLLFEDPPKPGVDVVIDGLRRLDIGLKIITGDHHLVALHAARAVGMGEPTLLLGRDIEALDDAELRQRVSSVDLFAEIDPRQKERVVRALRAEGHVVGYLGDGINDAPSLRAADVGISVDGAVDVARESADFVLLEHDLDVLRRGVVLGRTTFANTMKYVLATISANFGNMLSMAAASTFMPFLPLLAKQILLNNLLSDLPSLAIARDRVDDEWIERPHRWQVRDIRNFMIVFGLLSSAFDLLTFALLYWLTSGDVEAFRTGWFIESLLTEVGVLLVIRTRLRAWRSRPSPGLLIATALVAAGAVLLPWTAFGAWFGLVHVRPVVLLAVGLIVLAYLLASELSKGPFYRWLARDTAGQGGQPPVVSHPADANRRRR
ncbi:MAG: magnesium-translocating P-type ATPase [Gammaproteobacteria bacterium]|nr:magnesium-translocating P-type ATPase [Gammaproteobacteria bacterium]